MNQINTSSADKETVRGPGPNVSQQKSLVGSSPFKYYIHDAADCCCLQLIGELTEFDIPELTGCARTTKTILGSRPLVLDLQKLTTVDDADRQWIASMVAEGAVCKPESFLRDRLAGNVAGKRPVAGRSGAFARLLSFVRGSRVIATE